MISPRGLLLRTFATAVFGAGVILAAVPAYADGMNNADCGNCHAAVQSLNVDASSYKLWPSGSKTLLDDVWLPGASTASFSLVNGGTAAIPATNVTIVVENHDPLTQVPVNAMSYTYGVPGLAPQTTATITVPLDYNQCDIFLTLDVGNGVPTVFRTGNPAAC